MVLLTGATGYLGSQLADEMIRRGMEFRVLVRPLAKRAQSRSGSMPKYESMSGCEIARGDLRDPESLARACAGIDSVIHTAALVKMWARDDREFWRVNLEGLKNLCQAAADARVKRIIYTSSFIALGPSADANAGEGLTRRGPYSNSYEATKAEALAWLREDGFRRFPVLALLPGVIYGPGPDTEGNLIGGMIKQYLAGRFPGLLGSGEQRWSFCFISDVIETHLEALHTGKTGEEYVLGGDNRSLNSFFQVLARLSGVRHRVRHLPFWVGKLVGTVEVARARLTGRTPQLTPGVVEIFKHDWVYASSKASREVGYRCRTLEDGLSATLQAASSVPPNQEPRNV